VSCSSQLLGMPQDGPPGMQNYSPANQKNLTTAQFGGTMVTICGDSGHRKDRPGKP